MQIKLHCNDFFLSLDLFFDSLKGSQPQLPHAIQSVESAVLLLFLLMTFKNLNLTGLPFNQTVVRLSFITFYESCLPNTDQRETISNKSPKQIPYYNIFIRTTYFIVARKWGTKLGD